MTYRKPRHYTGKLLDMMDEGLLDPKTVAEMALQWLSEAEVKEMMEANDILDEEEEEREPDDGLTDAEADGEALASAGLGTDEDYRLGDDPEDF